MSASISVSRIICGFKGRFVLHRFHSWYASYAVRRYASLININKPFWLFRVFIINYRRHKLHSERFLFKFFLLRLENLSPDNDPAEIQEPELEKNFYLDLAISKSFLIKKNKMRSFNSYNLSMAITINFRPKTMILSLVGSLFYFSFPTSSQEILARRLTNCLTPSLMMMLERNQHSQNSSICLLFSLLLAHDNRMN